MGGTNVIQQEWFWTAIAALAAFISIPIAIWSLRQSNKALKVNLPAPEIIWRGDFITVQMHDDDERHYGITDVKTASGTFCSVEMYVETVGYDNQPSIRPAKDEKRHFNYDPPVSMLNLYCYAPKDGRIKVKVVSRADKSIAAWISYPVRNR